MLVETRLTVSERRPRAWGTHAGSARAPVATGNRPQKVKPAAAAVAAKKRVRGRVSAAGAEPSPPEGWHRRLREQSHNLTRAIEMLEQAVAMMSEPRHGTLARAECLRGAGLITLLAASELLVVAGWLEADQAVKAGTLERNLE